MKSRKGIEIGIYEEKVPRKIGNYGEYWRQGIGNMEQNKEIGG